MAFPKDLTRVHTNLGMLEFQEVVDALQTPAKPEIQWLGPHMEFAGYLEAKFMFRGKVYRLNEEFELVVSILAD